MPLYDMKCRECGVTREVLCKIQDVPGQYCDCGGKLDVVITKAPALDWFRPFVTEDFDDTPIHVETKQQLKDLCIKHDVTNRALGDVRNITEI